MERMELKSTLTKKERKSTNETENGKNTLRSTEKKYNNSRRRDPRAGISHVLNGPSPCTQSCTPSVGNRSRLYMTRAMHVGRYRQVLSTPDCRRRCLSHLQTVCLPWRNYFLSTEFQTKFQRLDHGLLALALDGAPLEMIKSVSSSKPPST